MNFKRLEDWQKGAIIGGIIGIIGANPLLTMRVSGILYVPLVYLFRTLGIVTTDTISYTVFVLFYTIIGAIIGHLFGKKIKKMLK